MRHHIGACFGALERRILDAVAAAAQRLRDGGAAAGREHLLLQVGIRAKPVSPCCARLQAVVGYALRL